MNDWTDKGMASSRTSSAVGPAPHRRSLDWTEGLVREFYADASNPRSGRSDVEISCLLPMKRLVTTSPASWVAVPAWLAQASTSTHGVRLRSNASTAVLHTQLSVAMPQINKSVQPPLARTPVP